MPDPFEQALVDASYEGVRFPVSRANVEGGHDSAEHKAYLRDGAVHEPTGRQPYSGTLEVPLMNIPALESRYGGQLFPRLLERLRGLFESKPIGRLVHPVLGALDVHVKAWPFDAESESRGGVTMRLQWVEQAASVAQVVDLSEGSTVESTQAAASTADAAVAAVAPSAPSLRTSVDTATATASRSGATAEEVRGAFSQLDSDLDTVLALPELGEATSASMAALTAVERLRDAVFVLREQYQPRQRAREYTVPLSGLSVVDIALETYGSLDAVAKILAANAITSTTSLRPGRRLVLP
jgi:prophage DNA circulation protein